MKPKFNIAGAPTNSPSPSSGLARAVGNESPDPRGFLGCCKRCGTRFLPYRKFQKFCSDGCRFKHWESLHPRQSLLPGLLDIIKIAGEGNNLKWREEHQGQVEAGKKRRAMRGSAALNAGYLRVARDAAHRVLERDGDSDADRVRLLLESEGIKLPWTSGWPGSIFSADPDYEWTTVRRAKSKHKGGKCREIRVWR